MRPPADDDAVGRRAFDDVSRHDAVRLDCNAEAAQLVVLAQEEVADQVALDDREPSPFGEIGDGDAARGPIDEIVGDDGALDGELGVDRDLAEARAGIPDHLAVRCGIGADGRDRAIGDAVAVDCDRASAKDADPVAGLAAATARRDTRDAVCRDDGRVFTRLGPRHYDAVLAAIAHGVMGDLETACVFARKSRFAGVADLAILDPARDFPQGDTVRRTADETQLVTSRCFVSVAARSEPPSASGFASPSSTRPESRTFSTPSRTMSAPPSR